MSEQKLVLIVDDDADLIVGVSTRLQAAGYATLSEQNGRDGICTAIQSQPDAIVLDMAVRNVDDIAVAEKLKSQAETRNIPIVMLSACVTSQQVALDAGARFYITKPYDGETLLAALDTALSETETNEENLA